MQQLTELVNQFTNSDQIDEQTLRKQISTINENIQTQKSKIIDKFDEIQLQYLQNTFDNQVKLKLGQLNQLDKEKISNMSIIQVLDQINRVMSEENERAQNILTSLRESTDVLRTIGVSHDKIATCAETGRGLVNNIKQNEAKDRLIIGSLFFVFIIVSIWIIFKRIRKVLKIFFFWV
ncbi:Sec20 [Hexamita inflata]|uniref:Sec20 n=1 Tax=Hexamita inflata TaxID=28002 RepID=A0AA86RGN3_9EUKA|nr:Sec20 [Hexamita inflata]